MSARRPLSERLRANFDSSHGTPSGVLIDQVVARLREVEAGEVPTRYVVRPLERFIVWDLVADQPAIEANYSSRWHAQSDARRLNEEANS